jgi:hypothetical protein
MSSYTVRSEPGKLVFRVHRFSIFFFLVFPALVCFFAYASKGSSQRPSILLEIFLALFFLVGLYRWLWNLAGVEELEFTPVDLTHRRILLGMTRSSVYRESDIQAPRFVQQTGRSRFSAIGFDYQGRHKYVWWLSPQPEAKEVVDAVLRHFPELAPIWGRYDDGAPETKDYVRLNLK